jgi:hypothetical protein
MKEFIKDHFLPFFKYFPWYLLLWPVFYAYNINASFHGVIAQDTLWTQILKWQLLLVALFFFFRVFFSNNIHPAILTVWLGFLFFYMQGLKALLARFYFTRPLSNIYFILIFWSIITVALLVFFMKTKSRSLKLSRLLMYIFVVLTFYEVINYAIVISKKGIEKYAQKYRPTVDMQASSPGAGSIKYPDIYYLIFDSYTSTECFKKQFNYDNSVLDSMLLREGFYVAAASRSNYFDSPVSIAATLNMNYIPRADIAKDANELTYFCGLRNLDDNNLWNFLEQKNYSIRNASVFRIKNYPTNLKTIYFGSNDQELLKQKTLEMASFPPISSFFGKKTIPTPLDFWGTKKENILRDTLIIENELKKILAERPSKHIFFYSHCALPHPPYVIDSAGNLRKPVPINGYNPEAYRQQCIYMRKIIMKWIQLIKQHSKKPFIILVQGDHGYRYFKNEINMKECFKILNAWYYSDQDYQGLYNSISSVNTFRVILNKYFGTRLTLLKDTSYYPFIYHLP